MGEYGGAGITEDSSQDGLYKTSTKDIRKDSLNSTGTPRISVRIAWFPTKENSGQVPPEFFFSPYADSWIHESGGGGVRSTFLCEPCFGLRLQGSLVGECVTGILPLQEGEDNMYK